MDESTRIIYGVSVEHIKIKKFPCALVLDDLGNCLVFYSDDDVAREVAACNEAEEGCRVVYLRGSTNG